MKKDLVVRLNKAIEEQGSGFGPALVRLLRFGPARGAIYDENAALLADFDGSMEHTYQTKIIPKAANIVKVLTRNEAYFPAKKDDVEKELVVMPLDEIRGIVSRAYDSLPQTTKKQIHLSSETLNSMRSKRKMKENVYLKFFYDRKHDFLISQRNKQDNNSTMKFASIEDMLSEKDKERFPEFIVFLAEESRLFWDPDMRKDVLNNFGPGLDRMMLGDYSGLKVLDLDQKRASARMSELAKLNAKIELPGFIVIKDRYDDHRNRIKLERPGGLQYTVVDQGLNNFPLEIQYLDLHSIILDMFGPHAHDLYTLQGKKNEKTK